MGSIIFEMYKSTEKRTILAVLNQLYLVSLSQKNYQSNN